MTDPKPTNIAANKDDTRDYFRRVRRRLRVGLLVSFSVPIAVVSLYFHFQLNVTLKQNGKLSLATISESQRNTIDLFLHERIVNIFNLFRTSCFTLSPTPKDMHKCLQYLHEASDAFIDVGFLNASGKKIGYSGPYPFLQGEDYSSELWFKTVMSKEQSYHITDIYLGFRKQPHFTIAVRQFIEGRPYVMRATLDPEKLNIFLQAISRGQGVTSSLISREGKYQIVDPDQGVLLAPCGFAIPEDLESGSEEIDCNGDRFLIAHAWLKEAPWVLVVSQPLEVAYETMHKARRVMIISTAMLVLIIIVIVWVVTERLLLRAEATEKARATLKSQLLHAAKLASVGELAAGVAHEINNPLAIISSESGWIRDMLDPQFGIKSSADNIREAITHIEEAIFRAKNITHKLLDFARKNEAHLVPCNANQILDDVVEGIKEQEFAILNIELIRNYDSDLPDMFLDPDQTRQVFLNLINNAQDAINGSGSITLTTQQDNRGICVTVADTGEGMAPDQMEKIFLPFYTTKEVDEGTGLGLSVSMSIIEAMGGRIEVQSLPGEGSSFTVVIPFRHGEEKKGARTH